MYSECSKNENSTKIDSYLEIFNWKVFERDFSDYHQAEKRFHSRYCTTNLNIAEDDLFLDDLIFKICTNQEIQIDNGASLFLSLLFRSDFIQIYQELRNIFYRRICSLFILTDRIEDILKSVNALDMIPQVKFEIFHNLMAILNIKITIRKDCLALNYSSRRPQNWQSNLNKVERMIVTPAAFKVMLGKFGMNFYHLNFIFRLLPLKTLTLDGCNLNWTNEGNILNDMDVVTLNMRGCGTSVNKLIADNFDNLQKTLRELDISGCPIYDETLHCLSLFRLEKLNIRNCIKKTGYFIDSFWIEIEDLGDLNKCYVDINNLWSGDHLKSSLRSLDASFNDLCYKDMKGILRQDLTELNVTRSSQIWANNFCDFWSCVLFLKVLRIRDIEIQFSVLAALFELNLEILEFSYDAAKNLSDFSSLLHRPTANSLQELTIDLKNHTTCFINFLAKLRLKYFKCKLGTWYYYNFNIFWNENNRKFLKTLIMEEGKISESDAVGVSKLKLEKLSLCPFLFDSKEHILAILSSEVLQNSITDLNLGGAYEVDGDHLNLLTNFSNLRKLSLKISGNNLTRVFTKKIERFRNLKELTMNVFIGLNVDEEAASALCNLPNGIYLTIVLAGLGRNWPLTFTERAARIFTLKGFLHDSENPVHLELSDCTLDYRCAKIFNRFNLKSLVLSSCILDKFLNNFIQGAVVFTLEVLTMKRVDVDYREIDSLRNSHLNELSILIEKGDFAYNKLPIVLSDGAISKSMCVLTLGPHSRIPFFEYILKSKISVCQSFPS